LRPWVPWAITRGVARSGTLSGILWMALAGLCFVTIAGIVRHLGPGLPAAQAAFLRFAIALVFLAPVLVTILRQGLPQGVWTPVLWRGALHTVANICWFFALARLPVAEATAIGYLNPVLVMLGGIVVFAEPSTRRRWIAFGIALAGAALVLRPGLRDLTVAHGAQVAAAVFFAASYLFAKSLSGRLPAATVVALLSLTVTVGLLPAALWVWVPVTAVQLVWLAAIAGLATAGHLAMTRAFAAAPLAATQPVTVLQLVWATLIGATVFGDPVDPFVIIGGLVIVAAITALTLSEARALRVPGPGGAQR
jgi:drug/metabolite transporter (DMT)-like permease